MIYQLPSGKIVNISISAYLSMSDDDLKYMEETNAGTACSNNIFNVEEDSILEEPPEIILEIDITTLDPNLFILREDSSEEE